MNRRLRIYEGHIFELRIKTIYDLHIFLTVYMLGNLHVKLQTKVFLNSVYIKFIRKILIYHLSKHRVQLSLES